MTYTEFTLIEKIKQAHGSVSGNVTGIGDDCAVLSRNETEVTLISTDMLVQNVHFTLESMSFEQIGRKAAAVNLSDIAAMGGIPESMLVSLGLPEGMSEENILKLYEGISSINKRWDVAIVGGDTVRALELVVNVTITGRALKDEVVYRSGAKAGDLIYVTGPLGGSIKGKHYNFISRIDEAQWLVKNCKPTAMMDISDGIAGDLRHILKASLVQGAILDSAKIPLTEGCSLQEALSDGEDFELLMSFSPEKKDFLQKASFPLYKIGIFTNEVDSLVVDYGDKKEDLDLYGYSHG